MEGQWAISVMPVSGMPLFQRGMSVATAICNALERNGGALRDGDICVIAQKIVSKSEGRFLDLADVTPSEEAVRMAAGTAREPELVQAILDESSEVLRATPAAIITRHRAGPVMANAGIDASNVEGGASGTVLLWPQSPDESARAIRAELGRLTGARVGIVIADSLGRAWRIGTVGTAIGAAGIVSVDDRRGGQDLFGRTLQATVVATADSIAAMGVLAMGEGAEGTPAAIVRGCGRWVTEEDGPGAAAALRPVAEDMFR